VIRLPTPFAIGDVNAYLLPGESLALVDTGPNTPAALDALRSGLRDLGAAIEDVSLVAVTHSHLDHLGLARSVQEASGARIAGHPKAVAALADFSRHWRDRVMLLERAARAAAAPPATSDAALDIEISRGALAGSVDPSALTELRDGTVVALGDSNWTAVHTPGHTGDHIALLHGPSGGAFTGDLILRHLGTVPYLEARKPGSRPNPMGELIASWRRLGRLPLTIAWPGHGGPIRAHRILIARRLVAARSRLQASRSALLGGAETIWEVATALRLSHDPEDLPAVLGESAALLNWLVDRGVATRSVAHGVIRFEAAVRPKDRSAEQRKA
jgi:glyoxylase-like metal-dependent hydrolase (beta-lactamase superfamily II)